LWRFFEGAAGLVPLAGPWSLEAGLVKVFGAMKLM
jgi:hypothetical protein